MALTYAQAALQIKPFGGLSPAREAVFFKVGRIIYHALDTGNLSLKTDAWLVPDVCQEPAGMWRGLKREGQSDVLIYSGIPDGSFAKYHPVLFTLLTCEIENIA